MNTNKLTAVEDLLAEHTVIRHYLERIGDLINQQADFLLQKRDGNDLSRIMEERRFNIEQSLAYLHEGFARHVKHEMEVLPPIVGEVITSGIRAEHEGGFEQLHKVESMLTAPGLEKMTPEELARWSYEIRRGYEEVWKIANAHWGREEAVIELVREGMYRVAAEAVRPAA